MTQHDDDDPAPRRVQQAEVHPDGLIIDGTKITGLAVCEVLIASAGVGGDDVTVDLRIRICTRDLNLNTRRIEPPTSDF